MTTTTLTALYDTRAEADRAASRLVSEAGVPRSNVNVIAQESTPTSSTAAEDTGFFASLKNIFMPEEDRGTYSEAIRRGGFLLTATVDQSGAEAAMQILDEDGAVDLDERQQAWRAAGWAGQQAPSAAQTLADGTVVTTAAASAPTMASAVPTGTVGEAAPTPRTGVVEGEERIQLGEERLRVGKRSAESGRVRVRSYVVETPVEEQVTLRDESVSVERRTVDRAPTAADQALFGERVIEATETDEEAVVSKTAHVTGEVVVSKTAEDHVKTVHDTVRRTEVEIEDDRATGEGMVARPAAAEPRTVAPKAASEPRR
jgi:uncharacterized protein (TIGR02271 family)